MIFVAGVKRSDPQLGQLYYLGGGGDESKKQWFIRIGGFQDAEFMEMDGFTPNQRLWEETLLGKLMPFVFELRADAEGNIFRDNAFDMSTQSLYKYQMKYLPDGNGPLRLAFASESIRPDAPDGRFSGVLIYEIVK